MSIPPLSPATEALLKAARSDVPTGAARTKMWAGVSSAAGGAASVAATSAAASTSAGGSSSGSAAGSGGALVGGGAGALKMIALGTLLGGTLTVGTAAVLLHVGPARVGRASTVAAAARAPLATAATGAAGDDARTGASHGEGPGSATTTLSSTAATTLQAQGDLAALSSSPAGAADTAPAASGRTTRGGHARPNRRIEDSSSLSLEASLITEARSALAEGDALAALRKARAARALPVRQLVPEELAVEAQALRALGRDVEANAVDQALRAQYPESALAR
jgi:hypothetical protein